MSSKRKPSCACRQCPACITATVARESKPYNDPAWRGRHPLNPDRRSG